MRLTWWNLPLILVFGDKSAPFTGLCEMVWNVKWCGNVVMKTALTCPREKLTRVVVVHGRKAEVDGEEARIQESACSKFGVFWEA